MTAKDRKEKKERTAYNRRSHNSFKKRRADEVKRRKAAGLCCAVLNHGPGHQSHTFCECKGEHKRHHATYGCYDQYMEWKKMWEFTGYFDEPKEIFKD